MKTRRNRSQLSMSRPVLFGLLLLVILVIYIPIFLLILFSFNEGRYQVFPITGFSLQWYVDMFQDPSFMGALWNSVALAGATSLTATVIGFFGAYAVVRADFRGKELVSNVMILPLAIPYILLGIALRIYFFNLNLSLSLFTVFLGHLTFTIPLAFLTIRARIAQTSSTYEEAAWSLGANRLVTLKEVVLPLAFPGIISSILLTFTYAFDEFVIAYFLTQFEVTLPIKIWSTLITGFDPRVNALGTVVFMLTVVVAIFGRSTIASPTIRRQ